MYVKRHQARDGEHHIICESYRDGGCWKHRSLMDLGPDPRQYIKYPGGNSFYIAESVEERLQEMEVVYSDHELESIFLPFLDPEIRRVIQRFNRYTGRGGGRRKYTSNEMIAQQRKLHPFDKRRLHYLRCGRVDIGNLDMRPWKFLNVLLEKSRDEIECILREMERELPPHEIRPYLFTALHLQTHFSHLLTRNQPWALDPERVDDYFVSDLCRLNRDETFFRGVEDHDFRWLHSYLVRYLILYFDNRLDTPFVTHDRMEEFARRQPFSRVRRTKVTGRLSAHEQEACRWLEVSPDQFMEMNRSELISQFRRRAMETHPDRGGTPEEFVRIHQAYACLLRRKQ